MNILPFDQIKDVVQVYPSSYMSADALWEQSPNCEVAKIGTSQRICVELSSFTGTFVGFQILLVGEGNIQAISDWCRTEEITRSRMGSMKIKSVDVFEVFLPWLAIVVEDYQS